MNGFMVQNLSERDHERARELAAARPDGFLTTDEAAWLDGHLAACEACRIVAAQYGAQRSLFDVARATYPEAPRDLWARTAAAMETTARGGNRGGNRGRRRGFAWVYAPLAGAMVVAVVVGATLMNGFPSPNDSTTKGQEPDATPFALADVGDVQVLSRSENGGLELRRQPVADVCPPDAESCGLDLRPTRMDTAGLLGSTARDAIISPAQDQVVIVEGADGSQGVYVLSLTDATAVPTPEPSTAAASVEPTVAPASDAPSEPPASVAATETPSEAPTGSPAASQPSASEDPGSAAPASEAPTGSAEPTASAPASDAPTGDPTPAPTEVPASEAPSEPAASGDTTAPSEAPSTAPEPTPSVAVTPRADGAIEIASQVVLIGTTAAYSPDGTRFAFSARPADGTAGPDVFVWRVGDRRAQAVTTDHGSLFAGWLGDRLLVSRVVGGEARTLSRPVDGGADAERLAADGAMWLPTVGPRAATAIWWDGAVRTGSDGFTRTPGRGILVLGTWPAGGSGTRQVLAETGLTDWQAEWDDSGTLLAVWTSTAAAGQPGTLRVFTVDPETGLADLANPVLAGERAYEGFSLRSGRLTWSAPADGGDRTVQVLAWKGDTFGRLEILTEDGTTVVR